MTTTTEDRVTHFQSQAEEHLAASTGAEASGAAATYPITGNVTISILGVGVGKIVAQIEFAGGKTRKFESWIYGPLVGAGGISFGGGSFGVPAESLTGKASCALYLTPAGVTVTWWNEARHLGTFIGAGPNLGTGSGGGQGDWTAG